MSNELVSLLANIALTLSVIVAVIFGIAQVRSASKDRRERLTLDTLRSFQTKEFAGLMHFMHTVKMPASYAEWPAWPKEDQVDLVHLLQEMESLGILLAERLIDINLLDKTLGSFVTTSWERCKPLITEMRADGGGPFLAEYFQWMAGQIAQRMQEKPRKPFYLTRNTAV